MSDEVLELGDWGYFLIAVSWIMVLVSFVFSAYATWAGWADQTAARERGADSAALKSRRIILVLTILCMWSFTAISVCDAIGLPHFVSQKESGLDGSWDSWWTNWEHSAPSYLMWNVFWAVAKVNLYLVYLFRIYVVAQETKYSAQSVLYYVAMALIVCQFVCLALWVYYYNISWYVFEEWAEDQYDSLTAISWSILALDVAISLLLIWIYLKSIQNLFRSLPDGALQRDSIKVTGGATDMATPDTASPDTDNESSTPQKGWDAHEQELVHTVTRLFVCAMVSFCSSVFYQLLFGIAITEEFYGSHTHTAFYYFSFTWNVDSTLNVICLFLSLSIGKNMYHSLCKCDACCFRNIKKFTK